MATSTQRPSDSGHDARGGRALSLDGAIDERTSSVANSTSSNTRTEIAGLHAAAGVIVEADVSAAQDERHTDNNEGQDDDDSGDEWMEVLAAIQEADDAEAAVAAATAAAAADTTDTAPEATSVAASEGTADARAITAAAAAAAATAAAAMASRVVGGGRDNHGGGFRKGLGSHDGDGGDADGRDGGGSDDGCSSTGVGAPTCLGECAICQEVLRPPPSSPVPLRWLPRREIGAEDARDPPSGDLTALWCGHVFHAPCAKAALMHSDRCPMCRYVRPE
ncbi:hypothetical protein MMPV_001322 [Pyropia vietnamensis]